MDQKDKLPTKEKNFKCPMCTHMATEKGNLKQHIRSKHERIKEMCSICDKHFSSPQILRRHKQAVHEGICFNCDVLDCDYVSSDKATIRKHKETKHEGKVYKCSQCDHILNSENSLKLHQKSKHEGVRYPCDQCDYKAANKSCLTRHVANIHERKRWSCDSCDYQSGDSRHLRIHRETKHKTRVCEQCDFKETNSIVFKSHLLSEHNEKPKTENIEGEEYLCCSEPTCTYKSTRRKNMLLHWDSHVNGERLYFCDNCHYKAKNITKLNNHIKTGEHLKSLPPGTTECAKGQCTYRSTKPKNMTKHEISHVDPGDIRFICDFCDYESKKISQLKGHSRRDHKNIRYNCNQCSFVANSKGSVRRHVTTEHEGKTIACELCPYVGKRPDSLKNHIQIEHEKRRYNCQLCEFLAKSQQYLDHHVKVKHEGFRFQCDQCDHTATQIGVLNIHKKKAHTMNGTTNTNVHKVKKFYGSGKIKKDCVKLSEEHDESESLKCPDCEQVFFASLKMMTHLQIEHDFIKCQHCFTAVRNIKCVKGHMKVDHKDIGIKTNLRIKFKIERPCTLCDYKSTTEANLKRHLRLKHGHKKVMKCSECDFETSNRTSLRNHGDQHNGVKYPCDQCDYVGAVKDYLLRHKQYKHKSGPITCPWTDCDHKVRKEKLQIHIRFQHEGISHDCEECDYKAATLYRLNAHVREKHEEREQLKCDQCDHKTKNYGNLKKHKLYIHNSNRFECKHCPFKTITKGILDGHVNSNHNYSSILSKFENKISIFDENRVSENWFVCLVCNKKFETKSQHTAHRKRCVKKDKLLHKCIKCDYVADNTKLLRSHFKIHEGNKFKCIKCKYKTYSKSLLRRHKGLVHKEGKLLQCPSCDHKTAASFLLRQHMARSHPNVPFLCDSDHCDFQTTDWNILSSHKESTHEKTFHCSEKDCDHISNSITNATKHSKAVHGNKVLYSTMVVKDTIEEYNY